MGEAPLTYASLQRIVGFSATEQSDGKVGRSSCEVGQPMTLIFTAVLLWYTNL